MSRFLFGFALAALTPLALACGPSERTLLLEVHARASIQRLRVDVISHGPGGGFSSTDHTVTRTPSELAADHPILVAVTFHDRENVTVHLEGRMATPGGPLYVATRCYVIESEVRDDVLLVATSATTDADGDGWPGAGDAFCRDPSGPSGDTACDHACTAGTDSDCTGCIAGVMPCTLVADHDPTIHPGAAEICEDMIDQDCDGQDSHCVDSDHDGHTACGAVPASGCDCDDRNPAIFPGATDMCDDGIDQNCDGRDALCDMDGDGCLASAPIGGAPDCNDTDPAIHPACGAVPAAMEVCTPTGGTPADEDCNGLIDELPSCTPDDLDSDGFIACGLPEAPSDCDCNDCDSAVHPHAAEQCGDGVDQDCVLGDMPCAAGDNDHDGWVSGAAGGADCDDANPHVYPNAPEQCADGVTQSCSVDPPTCDADTDHDGYDEMAVGPPPAGAMCEGNAAITPWKAETCNGIDDNCNGPVDEVYFDAPGHRAYDGCVITQPGDPACTGMSPRCALNFSTDLLHCGGCRHVCNVAPAIIADACIAGACACNMGPACNAAMGMTCCGGGGCRHLADDKNYCGSCGMDCDAVDGVRIDSCVAGACSCGASGAPCGTDDQCCHASCKTVLTDVANCGGCDRACTTANGTPGCSGGGCLTASCNAGYDDCNGSVGDGCEQSLLDHDHCGSCRHACAPQATCVPGMTCACNTGYSGSGDTCADVDECASGSICGANSTCTNTVGSYNCACLPGYRSPSGRMNDCVDVDECAAGACGMHASGCVNTLGSYTCSCNAGFTAPAAGGSCTDVDECATGSPCGPHASSCMNTTGSYTCSCMAGYAAPPSGGSCTDVDECAAGACGAHASGCTNTMGSYMCTCMGGYAAPGMGGSCTDVNECTSGTPCGAHATMCTNTTGSYTCTCMAGYGAPPTGGSCTDIDECATMPSACGGAAGHATCVNSIGSYSCSCDMGFGDCDTMRSTGCEVTLGSNTNCSACMDMCSGGMPKCCPLTGTGPFMCSMNSAC